MTEEVNTRDCPLCGNKSSEVLLALRASDFIFQNRTYVDDIVERLGVGAEDVFPIVSCCACGFQFAGKLLSQEQMSILYNDCIDKSRSLEKSREEKKAIYNERVWRRLSRLSGRSGDKSRRLTVLEFGCGWCDFLKVARASGAQVYGVETDKHKLRHASEERIRVEKSLDDLTDVLPVDLFYCNTVLEHMPDPVGLMVDLNRSIRQGGYGYVGIPDYGPRRMCGEMRAFRRSGKMNKNVNPWEHLSYFSKPVLKRLWRQTGFRPLLNTPCSRPAKVYASSVPPVFRLVREFVRGGKAVIMGTASAYLEKVREI